MGLYLLAFAATDAQPGNPGAMNRYAYVGGNPLRYMDPTGHSSCDTNECEDPGSSSGLDALHIIEALLLQGKLDPIGARLAYYRYYLAHPEEDPSTYQSLDPTRDISGIISTGYSDAMGELGVSNLAGVVARTATVNGVSKAVSAGTTVGLGLMAAGLVRGFPNRLYRSASGSADSLTPRPGKDDVPGGGLSFFDSKENPRVKPGKVVEIDPKQLSSLQVRMDDDPPGHVTVYPKSYAALQEWAATRGTGWVHQLTLEINTFAN